MHTVVVVTGSVVGGAGVVVGVGVVVWTVVGVEVTGVVVAVELGAVVVVAADDGDGAPEDAGDEAGDVAVVAP